MSKTIGQLEKEATMWKTRYEKCNRNLLEMAEEVSVIIGYYWILLVYYHREFDMKR